MITIYSKDRFRPEKEYIVSVLFGEFLGLEHRISFDDVNSWRIESEGISLSLPDVFFSVKPEEWLTDVNLPHSPLKEVKLGEQRTKVPSLFTVDSEGSDCNSDLFGGCFYLLSRYEEVVGFSADEFGRYDHKESFIFKQGLLERPLVNEYLELLWSLLKLSFPRLKRKERKYSLEISHDVDWPLSMNSNWAHWGKRIAADIFIRKSFYTAVRRTLSKAFSISKLDPYNNFSYIMDESDKIGVKSLFNFIVIDGKGGIDGDYEIDSPFFHSLLKNIHERGHLIGFHPSYFSFLDQNKTAMEFEKLKLLCRRLSIEQRQWGGRQHYLRWKNPETWRTWNAIGADYDSSVAYEKATGFRCGTCYEFPVFDLGERQTLSLREKPLTVMDVTMFQLFPDEESIIGKCTALSNTCKEFKGTFHLLFHNNYIVTSKQKSFYNSLLTNII